VWALLAFVAAHTGQARLIRELYDPAFQQLHAQQHRQLLQNPDVPALTQFGGLLMEGERTPALACLISAVLDLVPVELKGLSVVSQQSKLSCLMPQALWQ
jgi:hypothetical protein